MSEAVPTRRLSTGGKPPIKVRFHYVVEEAPSHDVQTPCMTAWEKEEIVAYPKGWPEWDYEVGDTRPMWSIQVYDTTPHSDNREHLGALVEMLHRDTKEVRYASGRDERDRVDVWGMPLPIDMPDEERVARCKAHMQAEIVARECAPAGTAYDFHIPQLSTINMWKRGLVIIDRQQEQWNDGEGGFLVVKWGVHPSYIEMMNREISLPGDPPYTGPESEMHFWRETQTDLGSSLMDLREGVESHNVDISQRFESVSVASTG
ncbi:hypothetical protein F5Y08DRAFT_303377 [Xylaria arbuscula]|nr:hypothetical protein F5Y08DRAFT_303377 [Xylaria arbuscula]